MWILLVKWESSELGCRYKGWDFGGLFDKLRVWRNLLLFLVFYGRWV